MVTNLRSLPDDDPGPEQEQPPPDRGPSFLERTLTAKAFCAIDRPDPVPVIGPLGYLGGRTVVAGSSGDGKTTFCLQAMTAAVYGSEFIGYKGAGGMRGLVLDAEQDGFMAEAGLRGAGLAESEEIDILHLPEGAAFDTKSWERQWMFEVLEAGQYGVVLADPLYKLLEGDSSSEREARALMALWDQWRMGVRVPWQPFLLLMPMHARKPLPKTKFTMADIFGSSAWVRGAEVVMGIQQVNHGYSMLYPWKRRGRIGDVDGVPFQKGDAIGLTFDDDNLFRRGKAQAKEKAADAVRRLIFEETGNGWTREMLMEAIPGRDGKASGSTIDRALKDMGDEIEWTTDSSGAKSFRPARATRLPEAVLPSEQERWEEMARE